jgi:hypothetical protein
VIVEARLFIPLPSSKAIAFARKAAEARLAIRRVFLAVDKGTARVGDHVAAAQVVTELILLGRGRVIIEWDADAD